MSEREEIKEIIVKYIKRFQARILCETEVSRRLFFSLLTSLNDGPGRLYSFLAVKQ